MKLDQIPEDMTPHTDDSSRYGYPPGVNHVTLVEVVIRYRGNNYLFRGQAQCFGWNIEPIRSPYCINPEEAPITHYRIVKGDDYEQG